MITAALLSVAILKSGFAAGSWFGPISTRNHRALDLPFYRFDTRFNVLKEGEREITVSFNSANDFRELPRVLPGPYILTEDEETERLAFRYRKGLNKGDFEVEVPLLVRGGGFLDPIILGWHQKVLRWTDPQRADAPSGRSVVAGPGYSFGSAAGLGDITFTYSRSLSKRTIVSLGAKLPTGNADQLLGSGNLDAGAMLKHRVPLGRKLSLHAQFGVIYQGRGASALPSVRALAHQETLALCYQPNSRDNYVAQWQGESAGAQTGVAGADATQRMLVFGYQRQLTTKQMLEIFFTEDRDVFNGKWPEGANVSPDFGLGVVMHWRL